MITWLNKYFVVLHFVTKLVLMDQQLSQGTRASFWPQLMPQMWSRASVIRPSIALFVSNVSANTCSCQAQDA